MDFQRVFFASTKTIMNCHATCKTYMYIYIDRKMKLVHILYKNPCISLLLEKERVVSYVKCLDEHINISLKIILIIGCSQISLNKLSISSRLWFDTWKKCAKTKKNMQDPNNNSLILLCNRLLARFCRILEKKNL